MISQNIGQISEQLNHNEFPFPTFNQIQHSRLLNNNQSYEKKVFKQAYKPFIQVLNIQHIIKRDTNQIVMSQFCVFKFCSLHQNSIVYYTLDDTWPSYYQGKQLVLNQALNNQNQKMYVSEEQRLERNSRIKCLNIINQEEESDLLIMDIIIDNNMILEQQKGMVRPTLNIAVDKLSISDQQIQDTPQSFMFETPNPYNFDESPAQH